MTTPRYLTVAEFKAYVSTEKGIDDALYEDAINTAEMMLDNECQRRFEVAGVIATARVFRARGGASVLFINDCTTITSVVENGATLTSSTDYQAEPLNGLSDAGEPWPFYRLVKPFTYWYPIAQTITATARITITATWGWPAIPSMVRESCKIIAKDVFNERKSGGYGLVDITQVGGVGSRENWLVRKTLAKYAHPNSIAIA